MLIEYFAGLIGDVLNGEGWDAHAAVGKDAVGGGFINELDVETAQHHRIARGAMIASDAHVLSSGQRVFDAHKLKGLDGWDVEGVLQGLAQGDGAVKLAVVVLRRIG